MKNMFHQKDRKNILTRLEKLNPDLKAKWGNMNVRQAVVHLADPLRAAIGERPVAYRKSAFGKFPINKFVSQVMPWPKGAPTAPEFIQGVKGSQVGEFTKDKKELVRLIKDFVEFGSNKPFPLHPSFGKLTNKQWARVMWRHADHHFRQFGV